MRNAIVRNERAWLGFIGLLLSLSPAFTPAGEAQPQNHIPNPSFELGDGRSPAFWQQRTPTDVDRALSWDSTVAHSGSRSLRTENRVSTLSRWRTGHLRGLNLAVGTKGELSAWMRTRDAKVGAWLRLYFMGPKGQIVAQPGSDTVTGAHDWTLVRLPFTVPEGTAYVMAYLELSGRGTAWFDDVLLAGTACAPGATMQLPAVTYSSREIERVEGFTYDRRDQRPVLGLSPEVLRGKARIVFSGDTARYDVTVTYFDEPDGACSLRVLLNGSEVAMWSFDSTPSTLTKQGVFRDRVLRAVDVQRWSRIVLEGEADEGEYCRVAEVAFTPTGRFQGTLLATEQLPPPVTLRLYDGLQERRTMRLMLQRYIHKGYAKANAAREAELAVLKTPADWQARQQRIRARLVEFFGDFGPKCPLNAKVAGTLDRPDYVIEKVIFESHPSRYCTANLYVPKRREFPRPAVLFTCGHAGAGKAYHLYHECCLGLVLKGYVVLGLDPTGQGERSEYFDPKTGKDLVPRTVSQHHYLARPSWLVGRSLAGYRTWDCIRALDYLVSRSEVDADRLAVVGNSGGGQMALLITAADERVKMCAAAHPGGSMENTYLSGQGLIDREILSLIPPRPCAFVVGKTSGEEAGHRAKLKDMLRFYTGLGVSADRGQMLLVEGVHDMKQPKREACYAWLNRWSEREAEGSAEPALEPEPVEALHCTETGYVLRDIGGESGQTLNAALAEELRPPRALPQDKAAFDHECAALRAAVAKRLGFALASTRPPPPAAVLGHLDGEGYVAEMCSIRSEEGIELPALLFKPTPVAAHTPVVLHAAELGKPVKPADPSLALALVHKGYTVLSIDVRGAGETDPRDRTALKPLTHYEPGQFRFDSDAVKAAHMRTTMLAMRAVDIIRATDYLAGRKDLAGRPVVLVGEGLGGVWAMVAAAFDARPAAVVTVGTVPSYKLIVGSQYYRTRDYFWVNGALKDFDLPDLLGLVAPRPALVLDPCDAMLQALDETRCREVCAWPLGVYGFLAASERLCIARTRNGTSAEVAERIERLTVTAFGRGPLHAAGRDPLEP